jgi:hypothetical protein
MATATTTVDHTTTTGVAIGPRTSPTTGKPFSILQFDVIDANTSLCDNITCAYDWSCITHSSTNATIDDVSSLTIERLLTMAIDDPINTRLMNNIAWCYSHGHFGTSIDLVKAVEWYSRSSESGDELACFNMGFHYRDGRGIARDGETSRYFWRHAQHIGTNRSKASPTVSQLLEVKDDTEISFQFGTQLQDHVTRKFEQYLALATSSLNEHTEAAGNLCYILGRFYYDVTQ